MYSKKEEAKARDGVLILLQSKIIRPRIDDVITKESGTITVQNYFPQFYYNTTSGNTSNL